MASTCATPCNAIVALFPLKTLPGIYWDLRSALDLRRLYWKTLSFSQQLVFDIFALENGWKRCLQFWAVRTRNAASRHNGRKRFFDTFSTSEPPKVVRDRQFFTLLLGNVLRATTACTWHRNFQVQDTEVLHVHFQVEDVINRFHKCVKSFFDIQLPKWSDSEVFPMFLTWKCASRQNGVHLLSTCQGSKWSGHGENCTFAQMNLLRDKTAIFHQSSGASSAKGCPPLERAYFSTLRSHSLEKHSESRLCLPDSRICI